MKFRLLLVLSLCLTFPAFGAAKGKKGKSKRHPLLPRFEKSKASAAAPRSIISSEIGGRDLGFLQDALVNAERQAWLGGIAKTRAEADQVKAVGDALQSMLTEETNVLKQLAMGQGVQLVRTGAEQGSTNTKLEENFRGLEGAILDKRVMEEIAETAGEAVQIYEIGVGSENADIKQVATQLLPLSKEKLQIVRRVAGISMSGAAPVLRGSPSTRALNE